MLYATPNNSAYDYQGYTEDKAFQELLHIHYNEITEVQADGDELEVCCRILGRELPPMGVYTFLGDNAKEIAANWY